MMSRSVRSKPFAGCGALDDFSQAIQLYPKNAAPYGARSLIYSDLREYDRALADYSAVAPARERKPVNTASYEVGKWLGAIPRDWAGEAA